ncbi:MAG: methionine synthase [Anaerolineae bacterium]|jgi:5-methyltetrahydrofolate--homocysteine methyltransferase|nr:methionine synthase [Anaerolineae bacterium]
MEKQSAYLEAIQNRLVIFDGATGTNLEEYPLTEADFGGKPLLGLFDALPTYAPHWVEKNHRSFLEVGADVIETDSFRSNRITLGEFGVEDRVYEFNLNAAKVARKVADEFSTPDRPRFVAGSMGPTGKLPSVDDPTLSQITFDEISAVYQEQAFGLMDGGVDLLLLETSQDILEMKAAITGIRAAQAERGVWLPIQAQFTLDANGRMLPGTNVEAAWAILKGFDIDVIGINCSTGPEHMRDTLRWLGEHATLPISCLPNAGMPLNEGGKVRYPMTPERFADYMKDYVEEYGLSVVGGCCGTTPEHISCLISSLADSQPATIEKHNQPTLASLMEATDIRQKPAPFLIGERLNTQGSRKFKRLMLDKNFEEALQIGIQQVESGAHGLDLCVALTEEDNEVELMHAMIKQVAPRLAMPLVLDSTEPDVIEEGLKTAPGKCLINSINLEAGEEKARRVLALAKKYHAAVIALVIDEAGMAKTKTRKLDVARRIYELAVKDCGLPAGDLVFDLLTFTLATGQDELKNAAIETLDAIRELKEVLPEVQAVLGVSNISFGLKGTARKVLNSIMLHHAVEAGLDMAIVNPAGIKPYAEISEEERVLAEDLILNREEDALAAVISYYADYDAISDEEQNQKEKEFLALSPEIRLYERIVQRKKEGVEDDIDALLKLSQKPNGETAVDILNEVLLPAMKEVGDKFGSGELILPFVLQSAEAMKKAVAHLELFFDQEENVSRGKMVLATVYGDVHDIGKNLVKTILENNGFEVIDLGKQVPADTIIDTAVEQKADAIGLSALLVSTSQQMPIVVEKLKRKGLDIPVLVGGAAINRSFAERASLVYDDKPYAAGVYFCKDAFDGLDVMNSLFVEKTTPPQLVAAEGTVLRIDREIPETPQKVRPVFHKNTQIDVIPTPPVWGARRVPSVRTHDLATMIDKRELFRLEWGVRGVRGAEKEQLLQEAELRLQRMVNELAENPWMEPKGVYGYIPVQSEGNSIIVYEPEAARRGKYVEYCRWEFPRQPGENGLCLADYVLDVSTGKMDVCGLHVVTAGEGASQRFTELQDAGEYTEAFYVHGFAVEMAEAMAHFTHGLIRKELGLAPDQGQRYSWGYPICPDNSQQKDVFALTKATEELGMQLTDHFQMVPEESTAAIIFHHPAAHYYTMRLKRWKE